MSIFPRSDASAQKLTQKRAARARSVVALVVALVTGVAAMLRLQWDRSQTVCLSSTPDGLEPMSPSGAGAPRRPELIRSVRSFSSLQIVNAKEKPFNKYITAAAIEHAIDPALLRAVIQTESNFVPRVVSPKGARGLMQLLPTTAREFGVGRRMLFNARENIRAGAAYLSQLANRFGENRAELIIAAYNAGPGAVLRYDGVPPYPETQEYVRRVTKRWCDAAPVTEDHHDAVVTPETSGPRLAAVRQVRSRLGHRAPGQRYAVKVLKGRQRGPSLAKLAGRKATRSRVTSGITARVAHRGSRHALKVRARRA